MCLSVGFSVYPGVRVFPSEFFPRSSVSTELRGLFASLSSLRTYCFQACEVAPPGRELRLSHFFLFRVVSLLWNISLFPFPFSSVNEDSD